MASWAEHAIWWQVYPLGFTGAEKAAPATDEPVRHRLRQLAGWLDYAVELGCSGLLLGPVFAAETHGYDTVDHFEIDRRLGDQADFDHLVAEAAARGMRIVLDGVFNHVGRSFPAFQAALAGGPASPAARWFRRDAGSGEYATFEGHHQLVVLDHEEPEVLSYVTQVMTHWLDRGAAGWRLDAAVGNHDVTRLASRLTDERHVGHALAVLLTVGGIPSIYYGDEQGFGGVKEQRAGGDDEIRPAFPASPAGLPPGGWPVYRLHQRLIGLRRRHPWLVRARTTVPHLTNQAIAVQAAAGEAAVLVLLNAGDEPFRFPVDVAGLTVAETPDPGARPGDPVLVPAHSWVILGT